MSFQIGQTVYLLNDIQKLTIIKDLGNLNFIDNEFWIKGFSEMKSNELLNYKGRNKFYTKGIKIDREKTTMAVLAGLIAFLLIIK